MLLAMTPSLRAQVVTDGTAGPAATLQGPAFAIPESLGTRNGGNLLHSFSQFNLQSGESATFSAANPGIARVIARVTGGASSIRGTLRSTIPNADFYLINPSGVVFGPGASLDIAGSFTVTTASHLTLADGGVVHAVQVDQTNLTTAAPSAFGFLTTPAAITIDSATLSVPSTRALTLVGGDVTVTGGTLRAPRGQINLTSLASSGSVNAADTLSTTATRHGDVRLTDSGLEVNDATAGRVAIRGGRLILTNSGLNAQTSSGNGGDIDLRVDRDLIATDDSRISTATTGAGSAGDVRITTGTLALLEGAAITASTTGSGAGGDVVVQASDSVTIDGDNLVAHSGITSSTSAAVNGGPGGDIRIDTPRLTLLDRGLILANTFGSGAGGAVHVTADRVLIQGQRGQDGTGIGAQTVALNNGGTGGAINLTVGELVIRQGSLGASTFGSGPGGAITVTADRITLDGQGVPDITAIVAQAGLDSPDSTGPGGAVIIRGRPQLIVRNGAFISARAFAHGDAGNIDLELASLHLSNLSAIESENTGQADAGTVSIDAARIALRDHAFVATASRGGDGGDVTLSGARTIRVGRSTISAEAARDGGSVTLLATRRIDIDHSIITAQAGRDGGNITLDPVYVVLDHATLTANAQQGTGGVIAITATYFLPGGRSVITASSEFGVDGVINIDAPQLDIAGSLVPLRVGLLGDDLQLQDVCNVAGVSSLIVVGRGGTPPRPEGWLFSH
jgi:filamentous hemagglutinin family protein